jgi:hypothetical protein
MTYAFRVLGLSLTRVGSGPLGAFSARSPRCGLEETRPRIALVILEGIDLHVAIRPINKLC